ncbi:hypothetical protein ACYX34_03185 [Nitrospira sp. CMX1]
MQNTPIGKDTYGAIAGSSAMGEFPNPSSASSHDGLSVTTEVTL